jgi:hypothetical protein
MGLHPHRAGGGRDGPGPTARSWSRSRSSTSPLRGRSAHAEVPCLLGGGSDAVGEGCAVAGQQQVCRQFVEAVEGGERGPAVVGEAAAHDHGSGVAGESVGGDQSVAGEEQPAVGEEVRGAAGCVAGQRDGLRGAGDIFQNLVGVEDPRILDGGSGEGSRAGQLEGEGERGGPAQQVGEHRTLGLGVAGHAPWAVVQDGGVPLDVRRHLDWFAAKEPDGLLFVGERGAPFRRSTFGRKWRKARDKAGLPANFRFYDLRHTGNTLTAQSGATLKDVMVRAGQSSEKAALIYQHSDLDRQKEVAAGLDARVRADRQAAAEKRGDGRSAADNNSSGARVVRGG